MEIIGIIVSIGLISIGVGVLFGITSSLRIKNEILEKRIESLEKFNMGVLTKKSKTQATIFGKKGDFIYIPENVEITGVGLYEYKEGKLELVNKKFIEDK